MSSSSTSCLKQAQHKRQHCKSGHQQAFRVYQVVTNSVTNFKLFTNIVNVFLIVFLVFSGIRDPDYIMHNMKSIQQL
jgi:hypothetical protein